MSAFVDFDLSEIEAACHAYEQHLVRAVHQAVEAAVKAGVREAVTRRRYKDRTGQLTQSASGTVLVRLADGAVGEMSWPVKYASYVDAGTRPHVIEARRKPNLVFDWPKIGGLFVGKRVNHPGTPAYGFAGLAYHKAEAVLAAEIEAGAQMASDIVFNK